MIKIAIAFSVGILLSIIGLHIINATHTGDEISMSSDFGYAVDNEMKMNPDYIYAPVALRGKGKGQIGAPIMFLLDSVTKLYPYFADSIKKYDTIEVGYEYDKKTVTYKFMRHYEYRQPFNILTIGGVNYSYIKYKDGSGGGGAFGMSANEYYKNQKQ